MRVLIADGDGILLEDIQCCLMRLGHVVGIASNGLECAGQLRQFRPDVVVLDAEMHWGAPTE